MSIVFNITQSKYLHVALARRKQPKGTHINLSIHKQPLVLVDINWSAHHIYYVIMRVLVSHFIVHQTAVFRDLDD